MAKTITDHLDSLHAKLTELESRHDPDSPSSTYISEAFDALADLRRLVEVSSLAIPGAIPSGVVVECGAGCGRRLRVWVCNKCPAKGRREVGPGGELEWDPGPQQQYSAPSAPATGGEATCHFCNHPRRSHRGDAWECRECKPDGDVGGRGCLEYEPRPGERLDEAAIRADERARVEREVAEVKAEAEAAVIDAVRRMLYGRQQALVAALLTREASAVGRAADDIGEGRWKVYADDAPTATTGGANDDTTTTTKGPRP